MRVKPSGRSVKKRTEQKGTITMVKTSVPTRVLSVALSAALCCTMMPAQGIAFAEGSNDAITQNATEDTTVESQAEEPESAGAAPVETQASETAPADRASAEPVAEDNSAAAARVNEDVPVAQDANATDGAAPAASDIEITRTSVTLGEQAATVFSHNGLVFQVNADDPGTAACIGWTDRAPEGDLQIPEQAIAAGKAYPVTRIMTGGGF